MLRLNTASCLEINFRFSGGVLVYVAGVSMEFRFDVFIVVLLHLFERGYMCYAGFL